MKNKKIEENKRKTIGFVGDLRRINVSLSRAKSLCVVFGDIKRLSINNIWKNIIQQAIAEKQVF
jgi:superfamily I DNA and/or RNA helicase